MILPGVGGHAPRGVPRGAAEHREARSSNESIASLHDAGSRFVTRGVAVECARFVAPAFNAQRDIAVAQLRRVLDQRARAPRPTSTTLRAYSCLVVWAAGVGLMEAAVLWPVSLRASATGFALATAVVGIALFLLANFTSSTLVQESRSTRIWTRCWASVFYVCLVLVAGLNLMVLVPSAALGTAVVFLIGLLVPTAFVRLPTTAPQRLIDCSLGGALARILHDDLARSERTARHRLADLDAHAREATGPGVLGRLIRAVEAFRH